MPAEIAFLAAYGVPPRLLLKAAVRAGEVAVTADRALLSAGFPEETFYRLLAHYLGMPYLGAPMRLALPLGSTPWLDEPEILPLTANAQNLDRVLAPRGAGLRLLIEHCQPGEGRSGRSAILSPRCLKALIRRQTRPALLWRASEGLVSWDPALSAKGGLWLGQTAALLFLSVSITAGVLDAPFATLMGLSVAVSLLFFIAVMLRLVATAKSPAPGPPSGTRILDRDLPVYTIVVPLLREARVVPKLIAALHALDYPHSKLDLKLMVEERDDATIAAIEAMTLPIHYDTIVAPAGVPRTKPRALNIGLAYAQGEFLVVYDAEDQPNPGQLRAAVAKFRARPLEIACLQARLAVENIGGSWLTRMFAMDYAGLYGAIMPGLATLKLPIPLGGTSNHFRVATLRRIGGWDSYNVTEDIDLGFRLARFGFGVEALDSVTFEEAPVTLNVWLPQRTRWLKGWMVTLMVHLRQPVRLFRELRFWSFVSVVAALFGTILGCLFGPLLCAWPMVEIIWGDWLNPSTPWQALGRAASAFLLVAGAGSALWPMLLGLKRCGRLDLAPWLLTLPLYLGLVSVAAWCALREALVDPQRWNKTEHGWAKTREE